MLRWWQPLILVWSVGCADSADGPPMGPAACAAEPPRPERLVVAGSGPCLALAQLYVDQAGARAEVMPSIGSGGAIAAVADRAVDVGLMSRPLRASESRLGLTAIPWAHCEFRPVARRNRSRRIPGGMNFEKVLRGEQKVWGDGSPIVFVMRERGDSGQRVLRDSFANLGDLLDIELQARRWPIVTTDQELVEAVRTIPGAFGFLDAATLELSALDLREVPTTPSLRPARTYFLLLGPDPSPAAASFVKFATSEENRGLLERAGCTPP